MKMSRIALAFSLMTPIPTFAYEIESIKVPTETAFVLDQSGSVGSDNFFC